MTGPSPVRVIGRMAEMMAQQAAAGPGSPEGRALTTAANADAQRAAAALMNAEPDEVILTHGTTEGVHVVLHGYPWRDGDELVTCDLEHAAVATPVAVLAERKGVVVRKVELSPKASAGEIIEAIASVLNGRTRVVALSHVMYTCGLRLPIEAIVRLAHKAGALVLADGAQTGGAVEIDVKAMDVDFYSISGQKWVLGPTGTGALYLKGDLQRTLDPIFTTHAIADSRRAPAVEFASGPRPLQRYRVTSQNAPLVAGFAEAADLLLSVGLREIEAHSLRLATRLKEGVRGIPGVELTGPEDEEVSSGLVSVAIEGRQPSEAVSELWERGRIATRGVNNPPAVRFCLAGFNTEAEVDNVCEALEALPRRG
jgi:L-cysteine/cystine lyase